MRRIFSILILLVVSGMAFATQQEPDILYYNDLELSLYADWGFLSPLEMYYYQNRFELPFVGYSTANYRGHVAIWRVQDGEFYLSEIQIEDYFRDPNGGWEDVVESYEPNEYGVVADSRPTSENGEVLADWFSGVLDCYVWSEDSYCSYFFQIRDGNVVDTQIVTEQDYEIFSDPAGPPVWTESLRNKYKMLLLSENYLTYSVRLGEDDDIEFEGQSARLVTGFARLSPFFGLYDNRHLNWPYNWENTEKCGAPHCHWRIENDRLYLTGVELYSGLSFYSIDKEELDLTALLGDRVVDGVVDANWVSGVYLIEHGYVTEEDAGWPGYTFTVFNVTGYTYVRIEQGHLTESHTVPEGVVPWDLPEDSDPGLIKIIEDYRLPSVFDTTSTATEGGADQAENAPASEDGS